jgi:hypothetical protein
VTDRAPHLVPGRPSAPHLDEYPADRRLHIRPPAFAGPSAVKDYSVRVELNEAVSRGPRAAELRHQLADYQPVLSRNAHGKTEIVLQVPSQDIWLSMLTIMASVKRVWYEPCAIQVMLSDEFDRRGRGSD